MNISPINNQSFNGKLIVSNINKNNTSKINAKNVTCVIPDIDNEDKSWIKTQGNDEFYISNQPQNVTKSLVRIAQKLAPKDFIDISNKPIIMHKRRKNTLLKPLATDGSKTIFTQEKVIYA